MAVGEDLGRGDEAVGFGWGGIGGCHDCHVRRERG